MSSCGFASVAIEPHPGRLSNRLDPDLILAVWEMASHANPLGRGVYRFTTDLALALPSSPFNSKAFLLAASRLASGPQDASDVLLGALTIGRRGRSVCANNIDCRAPHNHTSPGFVAPWLNGLKCAATGWQLITRRS